jgi:hypothetical protein
MIIRAEVVVRGKKLLEPWKSADDFTKMFILLEWAAEVGGLTMEERSVLLYPDETLPNGAPRGRALRKTRNLTRVVRSHQMNDALVPFSLPKKVEINNPKKGKSIQSAWFIQNITTMEDWLKVCLRFEKVIMGFRGTIKRFEGIMDLPLLERKVRIEACLKALENELKEQTGHDGFGTPKRKKRGKRRE